MSIRTSTDMMMTTIGSYTLAVEDLISEMETMTDERFIHLVTRDTGNPPLADRIQITANVIERLANSERRLADVIQARAAKIAGNSDPER